MSTYSFDAAVLLGLRTPSADPLPAPVPCEIVLRIPDGLTLQALRINSPLGKKLMHAQDWYDKYPWSKEALPAGSYRLRVPVPGSHRKTAEEQDRMLLAGETSAPVVLVAIALLCFRLQTAGDLLNDDWARCLEQTVDGDRVALAWSFGRLRVFGCWVDDPYGVLWASSVRAS